MMKMLAKFGPCGSDSASVAVTVAKPAHQQVKEALLLDA